MEKELDLSQKIDLEIAKIFFLANQINRKTEMCCFIEDVAHCGYLSIRFYVNKKKYNETPIKFQLTYEVNERHNWLVDSKDRLEEAERCVEFLKNTLKEKKIDYSFLHAVKEYVITSYEI